jgi:DNA-binding Lrp family transcriptional regulator
MVGKVFVLVETEVGKTREVYSTLHKLTEIKTIDVVTGLYDIIATIEGEDLDKITSFIASKIHSVPGINRTVTCLALHLK